MASALMKAATLGLHSFHLGHEIEEELISLVKPAQIGRILSTAEANMLLKSFEARLAARRSEIPIPPKSAPRSAPGFPRHAR
jgi:hypothetical protein